MFEDAEVMEVLFPWPIFNLVYVHHFVFELRLMFITHNLSKSQKYDIMQVKRNN